jgi:hypothetical protein
MKRADAQRAIDEAFADGLKNLFVVLERNLTQRQAEKDAVAEFTAGVGKYDAAHSAATAAIEQIFEE